MSAEVRSRLVSKVAEALDMRLTERNHAVRTVCDLTAACGDPRIEELSIAQGYGYLAVCGCGWYGEQRWNKWDARDELAAHMGETE